MSCPVPHPPKPPSRPDKVSLLTYLRLFRKDILSAQPARLYRAWMAEFRSPFLRSFLCNDPTLVDLVLKERPMDFPKSDRVAEGLRPLLRDSVFLTNGERWQRQRRIIDPAFEGGRLRDTFPSMRDAGNALVRRLQDRIDPAGTTIEIEQETSHAAADVIFRTLFSLPIEDRTAAEVFHAFRQHQRAQPILNLGAFLPLPGWFPRFHRRRTTQTAARIRALIEQLTTERQRALAAGTAPDDLASKIMTSRDPQTGHRFGTDEMVDQVAIFFLAGHETSASALAWALYLLALSPEWQRRVAEEAQAVLTTEGGDFSQLSQLRASRAVFKETLRLYPPVPMFVRAARCPEQFRGRPVPAGAQVVISPWHLQRHERLWQDPDAFDPGRWDTDSGRASARQAYLPFSGGPRVCPGAGFAMAEGPLLLAMLVRAFQLRPASDRPAPVPVAHLTVRGRDGIHLHMTPRAPLGTAPDTPPDTAPSES